jgi:hypothetical protein
VLVNERDGIGVEDVALAAGSAHAMCEILGYVAGRGLCECDARVNTRPERSVLCEAQTLLRLRQPDEDER